MEIQTLTIDSIMGPRSVPAPGGWSFDKTAALAWNELLAETRRKAFKRQRDKFTTEAKIEVLATVLMRALGMASTYWVLAAREIAGSEASAS